MSSNLTLSAIKKAGSQSDLAFFMAERVADENEGEQSEQSSASNSFEQSEKESKK